MLHRRFLLQAGGVLAAGVCLPPLAAWAQTQDSANPADKALYDFFQAMFERDLAQSPLRAMQLGRKTGYDQLDEVGPARAAADHAQDGADLAELARLTSPDLSERARFYAKLLKLRLEQSREQYRWRHHDYAMTLVGGPHTSLPVQLINQHKVADRADYLAYISRLNQFPRYFGQTEETLKEADAAGILPPRYFFPDLIQACRNQISGRPFQASAGSDAPLYADLKAKLEKLPEGERADLLAQAEQALTSAVQPAYLSLIAWLQGAAPRANPDHGVWRLPNGGAFYAACLKRWTSLPLTAGAVHQIGLSEVARIHGDIRAIMKKVDFKGDLAAFFDYTRDDDRFYFPDTPEGKAAYLQKARDYTDVIRTRLDAYFGLQPKAPMEVRAVEPFREKSAPSAFYNSPSPDGSRPGIFYANLSNMRARPIYGLETLTYHEGIPGHHMQIAIAQELEGVPDFQKFGGGYSAFAEGWALYTENLAKEMGGFQDPYSDYGRLVAELWRAVRLVVDTGIHAKKWDREKAITYFTTNTPMDVDGAAREIDRYIGWPAQATSYKIGMLKIMELRAAAEKRMGSRFNIKGFHDTVLRNGRIPLDVLAEEVEAWSKA